MKKFTLFVAAIMASAAMFAEVTVEKLLQVTPASSVYDIAVSPDGKSLYAAKQTAAIEVYDAATLTLKGSLKDPAALPGYGSAVAVDDNGAVYTAYALIGGTSEVVVYKWADETADATVFVNLGTASTYGINGTYRGGYGFDVKIDKDGNGCLMYPAPVYKKEDGTFGEGASVIYVPVVANVPGTPQHVNLDKGKDAGGVYWGKYPDVTIVDATTFWYDGQGATPYLCTIAIEEGVVSVADTKSFPLMTEPAMSGGVNGISEFTLSDTRYAVVATNNHGAVSEENGWMYKNLAMLAEIDVQDKVTATWVAQMPEGGLGKESNSAFSLKSATYVNGNEAWVYVAAFKNDMAVLKVTAPAAEEPEIPTAVENTTATVKVQKLIRNGQVLIIRDGKTFNMMGQEIR